MSPRVYVLTCSCGERLSVGESQFGKEGKCVRCGQTLVASPEALIPLSDESETTEEREAGERLGPDGIPVEWKVGDVILGLYEVMEVLGAGGMGKVFKVWHRGWNMPLAVKAPRARTLLKRDGAVNFERECETWVNIPLHPHIVSCYYVRRLGGVPRVFAEYVDAGSMLAWIQDGRIYKGGPQKAIARICDFAIQVAWGLQFAHERGLVHQDVKCGNILIARDGTAKVTDFGLARARAVTEGALDEEGTDGAVTNLGMTRFYCSPEQANREKVTIKTDMWSLAMSVLEAYTVKVIWRRGTEGPEILRQFLEQSTTNPRLLPMPRAVAYILKNCLQVNPDARPEDMREVAAAFIEAYREVTGADYPRQQPKSAEASADSLNNRAVSLLDLGRLAHAEQTWELALKSDPHHPESTYNLCLSRWRTGRLADDSMVLRLNEIAKFHPRDWQPRYLLAQVHLERGDYQAAAHILRTMARDLPDRQDVAAALRLAEDRVEQTRRRDRVFEGHADGVTAVAVSRDRRLLLTGSEDNTIRMWDFGTGQCLRVFEGHQNTVSSVLFSRDATIAFSASLDRTIRVWDTQNGACMRVLEGHAGPIHDISITDDAFHVLSAGGDSVLKLWDVRSSKCIQTLEGHRGDVLSVSMDPAAMAAVSGGADASVRVWDVQGSRCTHVLTEHAGPVTCVCLTPDTRFAISGSMDRTLRVWNPGAGKRLQMLEGHHGGVHAVAFGSEGRFAVSAGADKTVRLWEPATGRCVFTYAGHSGEVLSVCVSSDDRHVYSGSKDKTIAVWRIGDGQPTPRAPTAICRAVSSEVAISTGRAFEQAMALAKLAFVQGDTLAAASHIRLARSQPGRRRAAEAMQAWQELYVRLPRVGFDGAWESATLRDSEDPIKALILTRNARYALVLQGKNRLVKYDLLYLRKLVEFEQDASAIECASMTSEGDWVLTGGWENKLWDGNTGKVARAFERQAELVTALALTDDGRFALSTAGRVIRLWEAATGRSLGELAGHQDEVNAVCWSADARLALSGGEDKTIKLWEINTGKCLRTLVGHTEPVRAVAISLDGYYAIAGGGALWERPAELKLWDLTTGECVQTFKGHTDAVNSACISADSRYVLSGSRDKTLRLWNAATGQLLHTLEGHTDAVEAVALAMDGRFAVSGGKDGTVRVWTIDWLLEERASQPWHAGAAPYLISFLTSCTPYAAELPPDKEASQRRIMQALTRKGTPRWTDIDLARLFHLLGCGGYGWLEREGVMRELERMAASWKVPSGLPVRPNAQPPAASGRVRSLLSRFT